LKEKKKKETRMQDRLQGGRDEAHQYHSAPTPARRKKKKREKQELTSSSSVRRRDGKKKKNLKGSYQLTFCAKLKKKGKPLLIHNFSMT